MPKTTVWGTACHNYVTLDSSILGLIILPKRSCLSFRSLYQVSTWPARCLNWWTSVIRGFKAQSMTVATTRLTSHCTVSSSSQNKQTCTDFRLLSIPKHATRLSEPRQTSPDYNVCLYVIVWFQRLKVGNVGEEKISLNFNMNIWNLLKEVIGISTT